MASSLTQHIQQLNDGGVASAMVHNNATPDLMGIRTLSIQHAVANTAQCGARGAM